MVIGTEDDLCAAIADGLLEVGGVSRASSRDHQPAVERGDADQQMDLDPIVGNGPTVIVG